MNTYLVQRLRRMPTTGPLSELRFGEVFQLDYMGSAEFEFGAFGKFMRRMNDAPLESFKLEVNGTKVFGVFDSSNFESVKDVTAVLQSIADGKHRLKERADFPSTAQFRKTDAWAAIDSGIFWATENMSGVVKRLFANSVAYMDTPK